MRRLVSVGFGWLIVLVLVATPLMTLAPISALAESESGTPAAVETPTDPPTETPADTASPTEPAATETPAEATETPADPTSGPPTEASPTVDSSPTDAPVETAIATEEPVVIAADLADISITIKCMSAPETVRVTNNGLANIELTSIGSFVDLIGGEPFTLSRTLRPGKTAIFQSGDGAQYGTVLTDQFLYTDDAYDAEGVKVGTEVGVATLMCPPAPPPPPGKLSDLSIKLSCTTYAETIRVTNNGTGYIKLQGVETYIDQIDAEPFTVSRTLKPGTTAIYQSGHGAKYGTILTYRYLFTNTAFEKDGVKIATDVGTATKACPPQPIPPVHWIEVNLSAQYLTAWEGNTKVNGTLVSTGKPGFDTPTGTFYVLYRYRYDTMAGCIQGECYYVPDVPWTQYFTNYGHALHGAYWHNDFGTTRSHGCVNLPLWFAEWLWYWATYGTRLWIHY